MSQSNDSSKGVAGRDKVKGRIKNRDQNTIAIYTPSDNYRENLTEFIESAQKIHGAMFNYGVRWDKHTWNIQGFESTVSLKNVTHEANVLFTTSNGLGAKQKVAKDDEVPLAEPFASFAKAFITHRHNESPKSHDNHMVSMRALRHLYDVLPNKAVPCVSQLVPEHFDNALAHAMERESPSTLYVTGNKLAEVASVLDENRLCPAMIGWESPIPRDYKHGGASHNRGGTKAKKERAQKLPKTSVLVFLAGLWNHYDELEEGDKALVCMSVILMMCGFRMDEFIGLDINCIPSREEYEAQELELDPETGTYVRVLRIRVLAKKKNHWDEKIVPQCAVDTVFQAVERLKDLSESHRRTAQMMLEEHKWDRFASYDDEYLSAKQLQLLLGFSGRSTSNVIASLRRYGVEPDPESPNDIPVIVWVIFTKAFVMRMLRGSRRSVRGWGMRG